MYFVDDRFINAYMENLNPHQMQIEHEYFSAKVIPIPKEYVHYDPEPGESEDLNANVIPLFPPEQAA